MADTEKPFACSSPGCNMSFINEDHLVVHKKKHDMVLNLGTGGKNGAFIADQTPTPTRFIRNCEEVGLFQDLQNVNPFEETFRRAVESGKIGALPDSEIEISDDTLHTPHVFPHIEDDPSTCNLVEVMSEPVKNGNGMIDDGTSEKNSKKSTDTIVIQETDTSISQVTTTALSINGEEVQLFLKTRDGSMVQLSAIPVSNSNNIQDNQNNHFDNQADQSNLQTVILKSAMTLKNSELTPTAENPSSSRLSLAKMRLRQALTKNDVRNKIHRVSQNSSKNINEKSIKGSIGSKTRKNEDSLKKQEILERNRASSMRARAKRKEWIEQLENSVKNVNAANATLQLEIKSLQAEVVKLKTILLAHKDCPVTKAMEKGTGILIKSKIVPVETQSFIQSMPISSSDSTTALGIKRNSTNDISIAVKKQPLILPTIKTKQSILLPKTVGATIPIVTEIYKNPGTSILKLVDFNISDNKSTIMDKPILFVPNDTSSIETKIQVIGTEEIVDVDESLQLLNVASKTTGT